MKTVRMLRTGSHPVLDGLFEPIRQRFAESTKYQLLADDSIEPADVILAFMPDGGDIDELGIERRTYQDFVGIFFIADAAENDAQRVVRSYEIGLRCMANLAGYTEVTGDGPQDYSMTLITPERGHEVLTAQTMPPGGCSTSWSSAPTSPISTRTSSIRICPRSCAEAPS